jgi:UDP-N-acetylmuramoylalanine--D-glutamate ligase
VITAQAFRGKRYAVLGLARSGAAAAEALLASGAEITVWDRQPAPRTAFEGRCAVTDLLQVDLSGFDGVVVSPGVPLNNHPIGRHAQLYGVPVIGDIELFALARPELPPHSVIGVTGTNGKSTTVALIHHILCEAGVPTLLGGNIGEPIMAQDPLGEGGTYVLELSSFQIDLTRSLACDIAGLTNITPDHLDRYPDFTAYAFAKGRLFAMQNAGAYAVFGSAHGAASGIREVEVARRPGGRVILATSERLVDQQREWPALQGPHNLENAAIAVTITDLLGRPRNDWQAALRTFRGLPHRMEIVCETGGITFVNDSKATNTASAAPALAAFPPDPAIRDGAPRVHWILGGLAKEETLGDCRAHVANIACAYTVGEAGPMFGDALGGLVPRIERCELVSEALRRALELAQRGDVILLSPACASYDQFRDFAQRGELFRTLVGALTGCETCAPESSTGGGAA